MANELAVALVSSLLTLTASAQPPSSASLDSASPLPARLYDLPSDEELALRAGAWDRSVELERQGQLEGARTLLERAWGAQPQSYEVTVRNAWLSLLLSDYELASLHYQRAGALVGAGPESRRGLASALTGLGYRELDDGERAEARARFGEALRLDPEQQDAAAGMALVPAHRFDPELWGAFVGWSAGGSDAYGGGGLLLLPFQLADDYRLRGAYRHLELSESAARAVEGSGPGSGAGARARFHQDEGYLGLGWEGSWLGLEVMGVLLSSSADALVVGQAARLRVGRRFGLSMDEAALAGDIDSNVQLSPRLFVWPTDWLGLAAGVRLTFDGLGQEVSGLAGVSVVTAPVEIHLRGHLGVERWPVELDTPAVLNAAGDLTLGGAATLMFPISRRWGLGLQGEVERLVVQQQAGIHGSGALGLRWSPEL